MKKLKIWALSIMGVAAFGLTSCETEVADAPTINVISPSNGATVFVGGSVDVNVSASTNEELVSFQVIKTFAGIETTVVDSTLGSDIRSFNYEESLFTASLEGQVNYTFRVEDNQGQASFANLTVNVVASLSDTVGGIVYNIQGPNQGAWDLVADVALSAADDTTGKDLVDASGATDPVYTATWESANGTMFVLTDSVDFDNTSLQEITDEYNNGTPVSSTGTLTVDQVVIAQNARFPKGYIVIKVTEVNSTPAPPVGDNLDYVRFVYRK